MGDKSYAEKIVDAMYAKDTFAQWLGIEILEVKESSCRLRMTVRNDMLNGFSIAHGGITYALSDTALAFSCNSRGKKSVSVETSISHLAAVQEGDVLTAVAEEQNVSNKIGVYYITVTNQENKTVALFKGTVYRTSKDWEV